MRAALYLRISEDKAGERAGVERQRTDCEALCASRGWKVAGVYEDNDRSAYSGRERPEYTRLVSAVAAGDVEVVVTWHQDRLWRNVAEQQVFLTLGRDAGLKLVATPSGEFDPADADDAFTSTILAAVAQKESADKARRVARAELERAKRGQHHGGRRAFGHTLDRSAIVPAEAAEIRDAARRIIRGETLGSVAVDWNARGIATTGGTQWTVNKVRDLLRQPRLAGLRTYKGEVIGKGDWPPIIDDDTHSRLVALFSSRRGHPRTLPARVYLLAGGLVRCGECGTGLRGNRDSRGRARYACPASSNGGCGRVVINVERSESIVRDLVFDYIDGPDFAAALKRAQAAASDSESEVSNLVDDLAEDRTRLVELGDMLADGEVSRVEYQRLAARVRERIAAAESRLGAIEGSGPALSLDGQGDVLRKAWDAMTLEEKRQVIRAVARYFVVNRVTRPTGSFQAERIVPVWRFGD